MRSFQASLVALLVANASVAPAQSHVPGAAVKSMCPLLVAAVAAAVDTTAVLRVMRQAGTAHSVFGDMAAGQRASFGEMLAGSLGARDLLVERFLAASRGQPALPEIPQCSGRPTRTTWLGSPPAEGSDTLSVTLTLPLFASDSSQALIYVEWLDRSARGSGTLSDGDRGAGSLYLLERQARGWAVIRSSGVRVQLPE